MLDYLSLSCVINYSFRIYIYTRGKVIKNVTAESEEVHRTKGSFWVLCIMQHNLCNLAIIMQTVQSPPPSPPFLIALCIFPCHRASYIFNVPFNLPHVRLLSLYPSLRGGRASHRDLSASPLRSTLRRAHLRNS